MTRRGDGETALDIPGYEDASVIGGGASSTVYRARDVALSRWVAIKVLHGALDDPLRKRFKREGEITANLGMHPHIVQVFETGLTSTGTPYVAMELYDQGSVSDRLEKGGPFSAVEAFDIGVKIAGAVSAAHAASVLHRDIKPQNILLSKYGPALGDFGIARVATNLEWSQSLEQLTPMHAAPEVLLGGGSTAQSDIYSLGSTLYTMLAGRPPFAGTGYEAPLRFQAVMLEPVPPIARPDVPSFATDALRHAMAKSPGDRPSSADEFGAELQSVLRRLEEAESRESRALPVHEPPETRSLVRTSAPRQDAPPSDSMAASGAAGAQLASGQEAVAEKHPLLGPADSSVESRPSDSDSLTTQRTAPHPGEPPTTGTQVAGSRDAKADSDVGMTVHRRVQFERAPKITEDSGRRRKRPLPVVAASLTAIPWPKVRKPVVIAGIVAVVIGGLVSVMLVALASPPPNAKHTQKHTLTVTTLPSDLVANHGWVTSDHPDQVLLADSETGQLDYRLTVGGTDDPIAVVESGDSAIVLNGKSGEAGLVDIGDLKVVDSRRVSLAGSLGSAGQPSDQTQVLPGTRGTFYVVQRRSGRIYVTGPSTNTPIATTNLRSALSPAVVAGRSLWTVAEKTGALVRLDYRKGSLHEAASHSPGISAGDNIELSVVDGAVAVLDKTRGVFFTEPHGIPGPQVSIPANVRTTAALSPTDTGPVTPISASDGRVLIIATGKATVLDLKGRGHDTLGAPVAFAGKIYVPDVSSGQVVVLNDAGKQIGKPMEVSQRGTAELSVGIQGGALFINDPAAAIAFSVTTSGTAHQIVKSSPSNPTSTTKPPGRTTTTTTTTKPRSSGVPGSGSSVRLTTPTSPHKSPGRAKVTTPTSPRHKAPKQAKLTPPGPPGDVVATAEDNGTVSLSWSPGNGHGRAIDSYTIVVRSSTGKGSATISSKSTSIVITEGLALGATYTFTVSSKSSGGTSEASAPSNAVTVHRPPIGVADLAAQVGDNTLTISWICNPESAGCSGGNDVTKFTAWVLPKAGSAPQTVRAIPGTSSYQVTITELTNGYGYTVVLYACNALGCTPTDLHGPFIPRGPSTTL